MYSSCFVCECDHSLLCFVFLCLTACLLDVAFSPFAHVYIIFAHFHFRTTLLSLIGKFYSFSQGDKSGQHSKPTRNVAGRIFPYRSLRVYPSHNNLAATQARIHMGTRSKTESDTNSITAKIRTSHGLCIFWYFTQGI